MMNSTPPNIPLLIAAALSGIAALLHVGIVLGGAEWYRLFGAGEEFAQAAEQGSLWPHMITLGIAAVLAVWAAYALSGAGVLRPLPYLYGILVCVTLVYLIRGVGILPVLAYTQHQATPFMIWSSAICFGYGVIHAVGLYQVWPTITDQ